MHDAKAINDSDSQDKLVTDAIDKINKLAKKLGGSFPGGWPGFPEDWRPSKGFYHFHFRWPKKVRVSEAVEFCAVLPWSGVEIGDYFMNHAAVHHVHVSRAIGDKPDARKVQEPVLIPIPHLMEEAERVGTVPQWLQPIDDCGCPIIDSLDHGSTALFVLRLAVKDGETCHTFIRPFPICENQLPDEVIKGRPQLINNLTRYDREVSKQIIRHRGLNDPFVGFRIVVGMDSMRLDTTPDFAPQLFEVLPGPFDLSPITFEIRRHYTVKG